MTIIVSNGTRAAVVYANTDKGPFDVRLYVNCQLGATLSRHLGDATLQHKRTMYLATAKNIARRMVGTPRPTSFGFRATLRYPT